MIKRVFNKSIELADTAILKLRPDLFDEWDFEKNDELDIYKITRGSHKKVWWFCSICETSYQLTPSDKINKNKCTGCNTVSFKFPELASEWHPTKNGELTPDKVSQGNKYKAWWLGKCGHEWDAAVYSRTHGTGCPYCTNQKLLLGFNDLWTTNPTIAQRLLVSEDGYRYMQNSNKKVWWRCGKGHKWEAVVGSVSRNIEKSGCPYCSNKKILVGFNDMWTTNPELASQLLNPEDGYKYTQSSSRRTSWKCLECDNVIKNKEISSTSQNGVSCVKCSDGISFGEKYVYNLLRESNIKFDFEATFDWLKGKRYDFYLPEYNWIIEVHGMQHYEKTFESTGGDSLEVTKLNDALKSETAIENGIDKYIILDARHSTVEHLKNSIETSDLIGIVKDFDPARIGALCKKSFLIEASRLWESGIQSTEEIASIMNLARFTIRRYLKLGNEVGWCSYTVEMARKVRNQKKSSDYWKAVVQLDENGVFLKEWSNITEAAKAVNVNVSGISTVCRGRQKSAGGYVWMYSDEYAEALQGEIAPLVRDKYTREVVQLDINMNYIATHNSLTEAAESNGIVNGSYISAVCTGKRKTTGGFKWMYKEEYDKQAHMEDRR